MCSLSLRRIRYNADMLFREPPTEWNAVETAACFIEHNGRFLFLKRHPDKKEGNTWCAPGGKSDPGEPPAETVLRETLEETAQALKPESLRPLFTVYVRYPYKDFTFHKFHAEVPEPFTPHLRADEHIAFAWLTLEEALALPLIPDEDECIRIYLGEYRNKLP